MIRTTIIEVVIVGWLPPFLALNMGDITPPRSLVDNSLTCMMSTEGPHTYEVLFITCSQSQVKCCSEAPVLVNRTRADFISSG